MIQKNISLKQFNTFGIEAKAASFFTFSDTNELKEIITDNHFKRIPKLILGGGSNILFTKDFDGIVLKNNIKGIEVDKENEEYF